MFEVAPLPIFVEREVGAVWVRCALFRTPPRATGPKIVDVVVREVAARGVIKNLIEFVDFLPVSGY